MKIQPIVIVFGILLTFAIQLFYIMSIYKIVDYNYEESIKNQYRNDYIIELIQSQNEKPK